MEFELILKRKFWKQIEWSKWKKRERKWEEREISSLKNKQTKFIPDQELECHQVSLLVLQFWSSLQIYSIYSHWMLISHKGGHLTTHKSLVPHFLVSNTHKAWIVWKLSGKISAWLEPTLELVNSGQRVDSGKNVGIPNEHKWMRWRKYKFPKVNERGNVIIGTVQKW